LGFFRNVTFLHINLRAEGDGRTDREAFWMEELDIYALFYYQKSLLKEGGPTGSINLEKLST
jgi:hypothetical protein